MAGTLYGIGVGPGAPDLLTLRAHALIRSAGVIAYPAPDKGESFSRQIVQAYIPEGCVEIPIVIPMVAERFPAQQIYDTASTHILSYLQKGRDVVVLCEGDPFFYGSFMYLFARLCGQAKVEIVPGVSAMSAVSAAAHAPLCGRNSCLTVIPATLEESALRERLAKSEAIAIIKVGRHLEKIRKLLNEFNLSARAVFVSHASLPYQKIHPLKEAPPHAPYFSMIIVPDGGLDV